MIDYLREYKEKYAFLDGKKITIEELIDIFQNTRGYEIPYGAKREKVDDVFLKDLIEDFFKDYENHEDIFNEDIFKTLKFKSLDREVGNFIKNNHESLIQDINNPLVVKHGKVFYEDKFYELREKLGANDIFDFIISVLEKKDEIIIMESIKIERDSYYRTLYNFKRVVEYYNAFKNSYGDIDCIMTNKKNESFTLEEIEHMAHIKVSYRIKGEEEVQTYYLLKKYVKDISQGDLKVTFEFDDIFKKFL